MNPTSEQARQFAIMLQAGLPSGDAICYFIQSEDPGELAAMAAKWLRSAAVKNAMALLQRKPWTDMTLDEKIQTALDQHYASLAYFLYSHNYAEVADRDKAKSDTARQALEAKLAGSAGKTDALSAFFSDLKTGRLQLRPTVQ